MDELERGPINQFHLFISSTFEDLQEERAALAERVFPRLRETFEGYGIAITDVDLRWGIPQDGTVLGSTVDLCLAEAANSIPYFIAILGCRSGWVPEIDAELIARHPWISPYVGRSITELEIRCALNQPQGETPKVFCYRREGGGDSGRGTDGSVSLFSVPDPRHHEPRGNLPTASSTHEPGVRRHRHHRVSHVRHRRTSARVPRGRRAPSLSPQ